MADQNNITRDSCNLEIPEGCTEPHLETSQDLELLAQEIAEATVEEERRSRGTPSPSPSIEFPHHDTTDETEEHCDEKETEQERSLSPVDEATWVLVEAADGDDLSGVSDSGGDRKRFSLYRKFLARGDLRQKLSELGLSCESCGRPDAETQMVQSCSESIVICNLPQETGEEEPGDDGAPVFVKDLPDCPALPAWRGTFSGAMVCVQLERQGGLVVAGVKVWHEDVLSALASLQHLVTSAGLVSYADVDVPSLLARAA